MILLPEFPCATPLSQAVLFGFDTWAFPYQDGVQTHLIPGQQPRLVLQPGEAGAHDEYILYYGTVIRIGDTFHLWYNGNYGPLANTVNYERTECVVCYATSTDGVHWEKPDLGLVEFNGSTHNNIVALHEPTLWSTAAVLYDPEEPDANRRFKMAYEAMYENAMQFCVAFSPDGLRWTPSPCNPLGFFHEAAGVLKFRERYYVCGQSASSNTPMWSRKLASYVSSDFEHWSPCAAIGLDRGPRLLRGNDAASEWNTYEEVHLGAGLWNRENVILGIYGQWHGHPSGDRAWVGIDLGLALSHDALHYYEPIPDFRIIKAAEQEGRPPGFAPALEQGQGMENVGEHTLFWYGLWRGAGGSGVRLVTWQRDRLGMLKPFRPWAPQTISCAIRAINRPVPVFVNASGLGEHSRLRITLLDRGFQPISGYSGDDEAILAADNLRAPVRWKSGDAILPAHGEVHLQVQFDGVRPEDANLHAVYLGDDETSV